ncbi:MAG: 5-(carboxyamino)imidazole ribonucleotide synthase [Spirochaetales bacterium]|nr:5-(carboxyamino)imidazole ribonucleotide synthase [Spirochaetales bacterium]
METDGRPRRIGVIGGGQLGRMLILAGRPLGFQFGVLDRGQSAPAAAIADRFITGDLYDGAALEDLTSWADVTTFEIEHTDTEALAELARRGARIVPEARLLALINDKLRQKRSLSEAGVSVPPFWAEHPGTFPVVQKLRHGGYDGRGVAVLSGPSDPVLDGVSYYEEKIALQAELAVIVARRQSGQVVAYPAVDMEFHPIANIVTGVVMPARVPVDVQARATEIAIHAVETLGGIGILAVELFWAENGEILVNEIAPRPHNSGHLTIEACETSQFEQHLRAICDIPLGSAQIRCAAASVNLLGMPDASGPPNLRNIPALMEHPRAHVHWYDKSEVRPFRKMGHVTITAERSEDAVRAIEALGRLVWIGGTGE